MAQREHTAPESLCRHGDIMMTDQHTVGSSQSQGGTQTDARSVESDCSDGNTPDRSHDAEHTGRPQPRP